MNCRQFKGDIIEWARGGRISAEARNHARSCRECWDFFEEQSLLSEGERSLGVLQAPPELEATLLNEFLRVRRPGRFRDATTAREWVRNLGNRPLVALAVAAALLLAFMLNKTESPPPVRIPSRMPTPPPIAAITPTPAPVLETPRPVAIARPRKPRTAPATEEPFVQIPYTQPLAPWEHGEIMRMELPVAALIAQGFPLVTSDAGAAARADVLIGEDGRARAVRLISISERSNER
jgi:hypothetical protein